MISDRHPIKHVHIRAGDIEDHAGRRLIPKEQCSPDTILSVPVQYTDDTDALFKSLLEYYDKKIKIRELIREGEYGQVMKIITVHKQQLRERGKLQNTGGNCRVVSIMITMHDCKEKIRPADGGYLWAQLEAHDKMQVIKEPYKRPEIEMEGDIDLTDDKYEKCIKPVYPKAEPDAERSIKQITDIFGIEHLHPWQHNLLKQFITSMNRYEALNFPSGTRKFMGTINREAESDIGGNNNNGMKATYEIHRSPMFQSPGGAVDALFDIDMSQIEQRIGATLNLNSSNGEPMKNIEDRVVIRGHDAAHMNDDQILDVINDLEAQIKRYEEMPTKTKTVAKRVTGLKADITKLVAYLDRNVSDNDEATADA